MPVYESIVVVEDWISEHYFTAESKGVTFQKQVAELRKGWDDDAKEGHSTPQRRFTAARADLQTAMATLAETRNDDSMENTARAVYSELRRILGLTGASGMSTPSPLAFERGASNLTVDGLWLGDTTEVLWLDTTAAAGDDALSEARLLGTNELDGKVRADQPLSKLISELYLSEPSPKYIVVATGGNLVLTDRERWPEGRYLAVDVQLIADRNDTKKGGEVDRLLAVFGRQSILPAADGTIWWDQRLEESKQHAVGVSQDLRDGIRESIEIIANEVLKRRGYAGLSNDGLDGNVLARQSLRFLYRILFLLYAEASPELGVLPKGAGEYDAGYGLDRLRELVQVDLPGHQAQRGTHLYESLDLLFRLVNGDQRSNGSAEDPQHDDAQETDEGLRFEPLEADLFLPSATSLIGEVGLGNAELQKVLERLLLSKATSKEERGFISYANLGINQLGAVYEGLMSYTGFIAQDDLREVAKNGDASKGSWVVPMGRIDSIDPKHFVTRADEETGLREPVRHPKGDFVFRLAGRQRQQSASYYTPEVLTKFVVSQALGELLTDDTPADRILELSICEPALGSGAFAIEAVRQLAEEYLKRKQAELGREIPAEEYPQELQRAKAQIALHQVHGVDLNATAVELAEVSLWLDTMQPGLQAPWFGLRLKRGNSLIGARRATYSQSQVKEKKHLTDEPASHSLVGLMEALENDSTDATVVGRVHHFLLPGEGWGAAADAKEVKGLAGDEQKKLKAWARSTKTKPSPAQVKRLLALAERVETLWAVAARRLQVAQQGSKRFVDYWPHQRPKEAAPLGRNEIHSYLNDEDGAYRRLKRVMDAWNALWFWPLTEIGVQPPSVDEWLETLEGILGKPIPGAKVRKKVGRSEGQTHALSAAGWNDLEFFEAYDHPLAEMKSLTELADSHPWLAVCDQVATDQGFFHWELEFAPVFANGGFDLQVGNPPWVRPDWDEMSVYAEHDPWWQLQDKTSQAEQKLRKDAAHADPIQSSFMKTMAGDLLGIREFLTSATNYPIVANLRPDLYRTFMERTWSSASQSGVVSLVHPESHFTEKRAQNLRAETYRRLRRHWQFINELSLFEIHHLVSYGVHVYGPRRDMPQFQMAASLYHPDTVARSLNHEGGTEVPGLKTAEGKWDTRPHPERIVNVDLEVLKVWADVLDEPGTSPLHARMVYPVNRASMKVLEKLSKGPRVRELGLQYSSGWNETTDRKSGYFEVGSKVNSSWDDVILQGPHFTVANPFAKQPNPTMKNNLDWTELDLEALPADFVPRTSYQPVRDGSVNYDADYTKWVIDEKVVDSRSVFRMAWRSMANKVSERTLRPTLLPPGPAHIHAVRTAGGISDWELLYVLGIASSLMADFQVRTSVGSEISSTALGQIPAPRDRGGIGRAIIHRVLVLNSLTSEFKAIAQSIGYPMPTTKSAETRRILQVELDVLVGLLLDVSAEELCTIYRTQFPVLRGYEQNDLYDANGRKVPGEINRLYRKSGESGMATEDIMRKHPQSGVEYRFEFPFRGFDREKDMRAAYAKFSRMLEEHGEILEEEI